MWPHVSDKFVREPESLRQIRQGKLTRSGKRGAVKSAERKREEEGKEKRETTATTRTKTAKHTKSGDFAPNSRGKIINVTKT